VIFPNFPGHGHTGPPLPGAVPADESNPAETPIGKLNLAWLALKRLLQWMSEKGKAVGVYPSEFTGDRTGEERSG